MGTDAASSEGDFLESDWYKTSKLGTYLVVPAGANLHRTALPLEVLALIDLEAPDLYLQSADSLAEAAKFGFVGVDNALYVRGYCLLRS